MKKNLFLVVLAVFLSFSCNRKPQTVAEPEEKCTVEHQDWTRSAVIYEVNIRQYTKEGTLKAFEQHLPRLKELGVDILSFMPLQPVSEKDRQGTLGNYYIIQNYGEVNPSFGTKEDFKQVVNKAHESGFKIIIHWMGYATGTDNTWVAEHPEWYMKDASNNLKLIENNKGMYQLDYNNQEMRRAMSDLMKNSLTEFGIDGFVCNKAQEVPVDYWNGLRKELDSIKPVLMIAESEDKRLLDHAFDANYSRELSSLMQNINKGKNNAEDIVAYIQNLDSLVMDTLLCSDSYKVNYITNNEQNAFEGTEYDRYGKMTEAFAVLTYTLNGMPMMYTGQEVGLKKRLSYYDKDVVPSWNENSTTKFYKKLNELKHTHPALRAGEMGGKIRKYSSSAQKELLIFSRERAGKEVMVMLNLSGKNVTYSSNDALGRPNYTDVFTGKVVANLPKTLKAWEYRVFTR